MVISTAPAEDMPVIQCAICKKPVDHIYWRRDDRTGELFIKVKCHGDADAMTGQVEDLYEMSRSGQMAGEAFSEKRLEQEKK